MIIKYITAFIEQIKTLSFKDVLIIILICVIGILTYWAYSEIKNAQIFIESEISNSKEKFFMEFDLETIQTERIIRDIITEMRVVVEASQASLYGYHNGTTMGPFPFRRISMVDETVKDGFPRILTESQNIPITGFIDYTEELWTLEDDEVKEVYIDEMRTEYPSIYHTVAHLNLYYTVSYPIRIQGKRAPIGYITLNFTKEDYIEGGEAEKIKRRSAWYFYKIEAMYNVKYLLIYGEE